MAGRPSRVNTCKHETMREFGEVIGEHYHRECLACGARWLEQCARSRRA